jgi:hypothetical protein
LKKPLLICPDGKAYKQLGGNPIAAALLDRCFVRMAAWVRLLTKSVQAEFPSWELPESYYYRSSNINAVDLLLLLLFA